jgi:hypothetical protein
VNAEQAANAFLGCSWSEVEADFARYVARGEAAVARWEWVAWSETLREGPNPGAGDEAPLRVLAREPSAEKRESAVQVGYDSTGAVVAVRYFRDHWAGSVDGTQHGVLVIESVWLDGVLLRFHHRRHGLDFHEVSLGSLTVPEYRDDRLVASRSWSGGADEPRAGESRYEWDGDRLVHSTHESFDGALGKTEGLIDRWRRDYEYDGEGLLRVRSTTEHAQWAEAIGDSMVIWFRRSPAALRRARKLVNQELPRRIRAWVERVAPQEPVYGLGIVYSIDAPGLPPALGLGTMAELAAWRSEYTDIWSLRTSMWSPVEFRHFDAVPDELIGDADLEDAYALLAQDWQLAENEREPRTTLLRCARELLRLDWSSVLTPGPDFVIFVVADEIGDDLPKQLRHTVPSGVLTRLEQTSASTSPNPARREA